METNRAAGASAERSANRHVVFGSGGSRAILGGTGAVLAFHLLGLTKWKTIGGCSGGSIPAALLANGCHVKTALRLVIDTDFAGMLSPKTFFLARAVALLRKFRYEYTLPAKGVYDWRKLESFVDGILPGWPPNFWTVATCEHGGQVIFTAGGAHKYERGGDVRALASPRPSLGRALCATSAIPGILDAAQFGGENLFDGALSGDGQCPVDVVKRHFGASADRIVAVDVGEESIKKSRILRLLWKIFSGGHCAEIDGKHPEEKDGLIVIEPNVTGFHALSFALSRDDKWRAVIAGFTAAVMRLAAAGMISEDRDPATFELLRSLESIQSRSLPRGRLALAVEDCLREKGLF